MDNDNKKPFKVKDIHRIEKKAVVAATLEEMRIKAADKLERSDELPAIHLDSDGTEIDDEEYFRTLDENTELIAVFPGEHWIDPTHYMSISSRNEHGELTDNSDITDSARLKELVGQLQSNLCNVSVMGTDPDLESLSNMDPNSLVDITGKDFMDQLKDSGRPLCAKRNAQDRINLLKLLKDGAIFCSERYPEEAEAIDAEISRQLQFEAQPENGHVQHRDGNATTAGVDEKPNHLKSLARSAQPSLPPPPHIVVNSAESCRNQTNLNANERTTSASVVNVMVCASRTIERNAVNRKSETESVGVVIEKKSYEDI